MTWCEQPNDGNQLRRLVNVFVSVAVSIKSDELDIITVSQSSLIQLTHHTQTYCTSGAPHKSQVISLDVINLSEILTVYL